MNRFSADLLRLLAICAVLVIHATGPFEGIFAARHDYLDAAFVGVILNQLARFSVPVFLILSGYGLSLRYAREFEVREFFLRRAVKIGIPFLFWTLVFLLFQSMDWRLTSLLSPAGWSAAVHGVVVRLPAALFANGADYHFYFFIIILQCYLVFPLLRRAPDWIWIPILVIHLLTHSPSHFLLSATGISLPRAPSSFVVYWVLYFYLGMRLASRTPRIHPLWAAAAFLPVLVECIISSYYISSPGDYDHFTRWTVTLFAIAVFLSAHWLERFESKKWAPAASYGAGISFSVYIFHTSILRLLSAASLSQSLWIIPALLATSFAFCALLDRAIVVSWMRTVLGLPEKARAGR